jgi:hypothetical protein
MRLHISTPPPKKPASPAPSWTPPSRRRGICDLNFKYLSEGKGATDTARFGPDGITICDPNRAGEGADKVFQRIYDKPI